MCFAPQLRALFRHLNFQTCSVTEVFCTFWLPHVLRATTACTFSTSQLPKVVRRWCVLYILTWKCASRHNSVQLSCLIWPHGSAPAALASLLFDPPGPLYATTRRHYTTLHYTTTTTTTTTTLQLQLHHTTPHYIQQSLVRRPLQPFQKAQLLHQWIFYGLLSLKLPPQPCAEVLVYTP